MKKLVLSLSLFLFGGCEVMVGPPACSVYYTVDEQACYYEPEPYVAEPDYCFSDGCCAWEFVEYDGLYAYSCEEIWCESYDFQGCGGWQLAHSDCYDIY